MRPDWRAEQPELRPVLAKNNRPAWFVRKRVKIKAGGWMDAEVNSYDDKRCKPIDIERLLTWAYREELPKLQFLGAGLSGRWSGFALLGTGFASTALTTARRQSRSWPRESTSLVTSYLVATSSNIAATSRGSLSREARLMRVIFPPGACCPDHPGPYPAAR